MIAKGFGRKIYCIQQLGHYSITIHGGSLFVHYAKAARPGNRPHNPPTK
jgi:hypothetical protein